MLKNILIPALTAAFAVLTATATTTIDGSGLFSNGTHATYNKIYTMCAAADGASSQSAQTLTINVTTLPAGANYRVYKTTSNGGANFQVGPDLTLGENIITVASTTFNRAVKIQFSNGDTEFDSLVDNGTTVYPEGVAPTRSAAIEDSYLIEDRTDSEGVLDENFPHLITLADVTDGVSSQSAQTFVINVTSVPAGGATLRVVKSFVNTYTDNHSQEGQFYFANPQNLNVGQKSLSIPGVAFDRTVKVHFSSGEVEFNAMTVNGVSQYPGPPQITLIGSSPVSVQSGETYTDAGATAIDDIGDTLTVTTSGTVDTDTIGAYTLTYSATDIAGVEVTATRTVNVIGVDTEDPVIAINGSSQNLTQGDIWNDKGANANDNLDGNLSDQVVTTLTDSVGNVLSEASDYSWNTPGVFTFTYTVSDAAGNSATVTRTVTVSELDTDGDGVGDSTDVADGLDDGILATYLSANNYVTQSSLLDARVGSAAVSVSGGTATISLQVEQSADGMQTWSSPAEGATTVDIPVTGDASFFRVRAQ
jgi:hypothetical protein